MSTASPELQFSEFLKNSFDDMDGEPVYASLGGVLHKWNKIYWHPVQHEEAERLAFEWLAGNCESKANAKTAASCVATAALASPPVPERHRDENQVVIPTRSGYLRLNKTDRDDGMGGKLWERELMPPSRKFGMTYVLNCDYADDAEAPKFMNFLQQVLPDAALRGYVQEHIGYSLIGDCRFQTAQFWLGGGWNGKSTLAEIVSAIHERVAAVELDQLDGFKLVGLLGASLIYVDETPKRINEQRLKMLISGGLVQVERKYRDPISLNVTGKWIISGNDLPALTDPSFGFWRRLHIIPFTQNFEGRHDPLLKKYIVENELSGVLQWALGGLHRLMERGKLADMPDAVRMAGEAGKRETNSVAAWVADAEILVDPEAETPRPWVVEAYRGWCTKNGMAAVGAEKFWKRLGMVLKIEFGERKARVNCQLHRVVPISLQ